MIHIGDKVIIKRVSRWDSYYGDYIGLKGTIKDLDTTSQPYYVEFYTPKGVRTCLWCQKVRPFIPFEIKLDDKLFEI